MSTPSWHHDDEYEGPNQADHEALAQLDTEFNEPVRTNTIPPSTLQQALHLADQQHLEPWTSHNGRWIGLHCPTCKQHGHTSNAIIEHHPAGHLQATCPTCHDNIHPGILNTLGTIQTTSPNGNHPTTRTPTILTWAQYRTQTPPDTEWLVQGLLPAHGFAIIGSTPKAGKTWFLSLLAISCATGTTLLNRFQVTKPVCVHLLALEGTAPALRHRIGCLARGLGIDPDDDLLGQNLHIDYKPRGANLSEAPYAAWYCEEVQRINAALCLIDTVRRAARIRESGAGVEDLQTLSDNLEPLRNTRSVLFAHHARKMQPTNQNGTWTPPLERLSGSGDWGGLVEVGIVLDRRQGTEWRDTRIEIDGRDTPSFHPMRIIYEGQGTGPEGLLNYDDQLTARIEDLTTEDDDEPKLSAEEVSAWLTTQPRVEARASTIADHFGVNKKTVQRAHPALQKWGISWNDPKPGVSRIYWLNSPIYANERPK